MVESGKENMDCSNIMYSPVGDIWVCELTGEDIINQCEFCEEDECSDCERTIF